MKKKKVIKKSKSTAASSSGASHGLDINKAKKKKKEVDSRSSSDFHELKEGANFFYILPPWSDERVIWKEVQQHGRVGVCPRAACGKECILCAEIKKRNKRGDVDFGEQNRLRSRAFFNAVRKEDIKKSDPTLIKILGLSQGVFQEILEYVVDEDKDISDPHAAVCLMIKRTGKGFKTRYKVKFGEETDISHYVTAKMLEGLHDLDSIRAAQPASTKDLKKVIRGAADDDDDFDEEDALEGEEDVEGDEDGGATEEDEMFNEDDGEEGEEDIEDDGEEGEEDDGEEGEEDDGGEEEEEEEEEEGFSHDHELEDEDGEEDIEDEGEEEEEEAPPPPPKKKIGKKTGAKPAAVKPRMQAVHMPPSKKAAAKTPPPPAKKKKAKK